jgi:hypothetical protein
MDSLIRSFEELIKVSRELYLKSKPKSENWKICLILFDEGWKNESVGEIKGSTDILVSWVKNDRRQDIRLTLDDQRNWLKELEKRKNENGI